MKKLTQDSNNKLKTYRDLLERFIQENVEVFISSACKKQFNEINSRIKKGIEVSNYILVYFLFKDFRKAC